MLLLPSPFLIILSIIEFLRINIISICEWYKKSPIILFDKNVENFS